jgi:hypothetical protein
MSSIFIIGGNILWPCGDQTCIQRRLAIGYDNAANWSHCQGARCHGIISKWMEDSCYCEICGKEFCVDCWQSKGSMNDGDEYWCETCELVM